MARNFGKGKRYVFDGESQKWIPEEERIKKEPVNFPQINIFKPRVYHNMGPRPILIESRSQLKRELKERGLYELG